ncbi:MAG: hypothetical protein K2M94_00135 [Paramuribaculum sp.]|nr:hypothetical protein [Paramuribaculum sp.]
MKTRLTIYLCAMLMLIGLATSCNKDSDDTVVYDDSAEYAVMITSFKLGADSKILANLDSVFFTIDLNNAVVFNADSLPKGTNVSKLPVSMTFSSGVSQAKISMPGINVADTVVNYMVNSDSPINFSKGSVILELVSGNGATTRNYTLKVNVHNMKPDSLSWGDMAIAVLPTPFDVVKAQKTVVYDDELLTFATDGTSVSRASTTDPGSARWTVDAVTLPEGAVIESVTVCDDALYVIAADNALYASTDKGETWTDAGVKMSHIYGAVDSQVVGVIENTDGTYSHVVYPAMASKAFTQEEMASLPVSGTGQCAVFSSDWSLRAQLFFVGGRKADGTLSGDTWSFDGNEWAMISANSVPAAEGLSMVPYFTFKVNNRWQATRRSVLLLFGGHTAEGKPIEKVYMSNDWAIHWSEAPQLMQLPEVLVPGAFAQAYVFESTLTSRAASGWTGVDLPKLPAWFSMESGSRAVTPIESWECPYIYMFGGVLSDGTLSDTIWRGVINRLSFKPLQ